MSEHKRRPIKAFKRKVALVVGTLSAIVTGAFAAILISAAMTGTLTTVAKPTMEFGGTPSVVRDDGSGVVCTPTLANGKLNINVTRAMPGSSCTVKAQVLPSVDGLKVQGIEFGNLETEFVNVGSNSVACGYDLKASTQQHAGIRLTVPQNAPVGTSAISGQIDAVPAAQYDAALCVN